MREDGKDLGGQSRSVASLSLHVAFSIFRAPFLIWAGAIARTPFPRVGVTLLLLLFYALSYSIWGLVTLVLWERRAETRQVFIRCFFFCLVVFSALFYLPVNPVAYLLAYLGWQELTPLSMAGWKVSASIVHVTFHLLIGMTGLAAYRWALKKDLTFEHRSRTPPEEAVRAVKLGAKKTQ